MRSTQATRLIALVAASAAIALSATPTSAAPRAADPAIRSVQLNSYEARLLADMNRVRRDHHLTALTVAPGTTDVARQWSWRLARAQTLSHNPKLVSKINSAGSSRWREIEENVGYGPLTSPDALFSAYMHSAPHRANIMAAGVRYVGVGVVQRGSYAWNTVDFVDEYSSSYGASQVPSDGISPDAVTPRTTTRLARGAHVEQRFAAARTTGVSASRVRFARGATQARFRAHSVRGHGALLFRDAISLRHVRALRFRLGALARGRRPVRVAINIGNGWHMQTLRTVSVVHPRTVTVRLPATARKLLNTIAFRVSGRRLNSAAHGVTLSVADLTAVAGN